jgi:hypothetical protein
MASDDCTTTLKTCYHCKQQKPLSEFYKQSHSKDGVAGTCRLCVSLRKGHRGQRIQRQVPEGMKYCPKCENTLPATTEYFHKSSYKKDGLNSHCKTCRTTHYYDNHEEIRAKNRVATLDWRMRNLERSRKTSRDRFKNHPEITRIANHKRIARKKSKPFNFTKNDWQRALDYFNHRCAVCGRQFNDLFGERKAAADHWIPLANSNCPGTVPTNIVPLCHGIDGCNSSKNRTLPMDWLMKKFSKRKAEQINKRIQDYFAWVKEQDNQCPQVCI